MKHYELHRGGAGQPIVMVVYPDGGREPLRHVVRHSPGGFEWGYGGSGPSDLALSIVTDVIGGEVPEGSAYHNVKWALLASLPEEGGVVTEAQVREVLAYLEAKVVSHGA